MDPTRWRRAADIAGEALDLPEAERESFARKACGDGQDLLDAVLDMIAAEKELGDFLESPPPELVAENFGRYRAIKEIGHGGMSLVYLGERIEADFTQQVAIKVILHKSPGVLQESETRILSRLAHPNIARFLDAGATAGGLRYLVMEYIDGVSCTEYAAGLSSERERLKLFLQICAGVQYANRSLIIHRDLKPSNVLVDKNGTVKLLDFGIAKILTPDLTGLTVGTRAYTPDYASPEQILGDPVTLATDVYSLGVILCELVGGVRPRAMHELRMPDMIKLARTEVTEVPFRGDLEIIARKALRCDPTERYDSAASLARDIERYLEGKPIEARPQSWWYVTRRFIGRNRVAVAAASLAVAAVAISTGMALRQARLASQRFDQVRKLAGSVMFELHDSIQKLPGALETQKLLVSKSTEYLDALARDSGSRVDLQLETARYFTRLAEIEMNIGEPKGAQGHLEKSLSILRRVVDAEPDNLVARRQQLEAVDGLTSVYESMGNYDKALPLLDQTVALAAENLRRFPNEAAVKHDRARAFYSAGFVYRRSRTNAHKAMEPAQNAVKAWKELIGGRANAEPEIEWELARSESLVGGLYFDRKDYANARLRYEASYAITKRLAARDPAGYDPYAVYDLGQLANLANAENKTEEALRMFTEQLRIRRRLWDRDPANIELQRNVGVVLSRIATTRLKLGHVDEALRAGEEAVEIHRKTLAKDPETMLTQRELFLSLMELARAYEKKQNARNGYCPLVREAEPLLGKALAKTAEIASVKSGRETLARMAAACR